MKGHKYDLESDDILGVRLPNSPRELTGPLSIDRCKLVFLAHSQLYLN